MEVWEIDLECTSPFHTTGTVAGSFIQVLRTGRSLNGGDVYIPATHLKGVMRCEAERIMRTMQDIPCYITGDPGDKGNIKLCDEGEKGGILCPVCSVFGVPHGEEGGGYREGKIRVMDFFLTDGGDRRIEKRSHVTINREYQVKEEGALYSEEAVPARSIFSGRIIIRTTLTDEEDRLLEGCIHAMADYGIGRDRSRGFGKVSARIQKTGRIMPRGDSPC
ncbi:MAG: RAMP superfamily CRISPR-associated protein [Methanospirillum sp.]|nr:RAMP superfamily CRISPR-associated protein [Methanospirillum sp.]